MKRRLAKLLISNAIDTQKPLPGWVLKMLRNDSELQQYNREMHNLLASLREEASVGQPIASEEATVSPAPLGIVDSQESAATARWAVERQQHVVKAAAEARRRNMRGSIMAIAASLILLLTWLNWPGSSESQQRVTTREGADIQPIMASITATQRLVRQISLSSRDALSRAAAVRQSIALQQQRDSLDSFREDLQHTSRSIGAGVSKLFNVLSELPDDVSPGRQETDGNSGPPDDQ